LGFHYRITDLQCALGLSQASKLERFVDRRRELAARYDKQFDSPELRGLVAPLKVPKGGASAYHLYVLRLLAQQGESLADVAARRRSLFEGLRKKDIAPQVHYIPVHRQPDFIRAGLSEGAFPGADAYYAGCISLPMFPGMRDSDVDTVVDAVRSLVSKSAG